MTRVAIENPSRDGLDEHSLDHDLNHQWTLRYIEGPAQGPVRSIAILYDRSGNSPWKYNFQWSESGEKCIYVIPLPPTPTSESPFKAGHGAMRLDWMRNQLLQVPDCFIHPNLERSALTEASLQLQVLEEARKNFPEDFKDPDVEDNKEDCFQSPPVNTHVWTILPWQDWDSKGSIATISCANPGAPLLQTDASTDTPTDQNPLYAFHLTEKGTIAVSTQNLAVCNAWHELAKQYQLQHGEGEAFDLTDVFCFLQTESKLSIPPDELHALKRCVESLAKAAVERLDHPKLAQLKALNAALQYELLVFKLCLRKETPTQYEVTVNIPIGAGLSAWTNGELFQVMTTKARRVVVTIIYGRHGKLEKPAHEIQDMCELNALGVYFNEEGLGNAGLVLKLPEEVAPPPFCRGDTIDQ